jgi:glycosyltransferase involved in cell wall biosynthesis
MKFAFVTPRYGADISNGAEHACRLLAEQLSHRHNVDVLTTCARDPLTWANEYTEGADRVRGVLVRRFAVNQPHDRESFRELTSLMAGMPHGREDEEEWVRCLGPTSAGLIEHLKRQHRSYDAVVFFSLWHATTVFGVRAAPDRSILFPYLQHHHVLRFGLWHDVLASVNAIGYMSPAERDLMRAYMRMQLTEEFVGLGVDMPAQQTYPRHQQDPADDLSPQDGEEQTGEPATADPSPAPDHLNGRGVLFRRRHRLYGPFVLYGGRVEADNGSEEMLEYYDQYVAKNGDTPLVLMGVKLIKVPEPPYVRLAGVLPDRERMIAYEAAEVSLIPEPDDLLAMNVLESFAVGTPVVATARNAAAVDHCRRANAGLYYTNGEEFTEALTLLLNDARLRQRLGDNGHRYVREHYRWEAVLGRFDRLITRARKT